MRILLVYPDINTIQFPHFQHGLAWISAVLKKEGHGVELLYLRRELSEPEFVEQVRAKDPDLVAFSSTTQQFSFARRYGNAVKAALKKPLVIGGIHATVAAETVMEEGVFDFLVRSEGEYPLLELADALEQDRDPSDIENLWVRLPSGEVKKNPLRPPVNLEDLPWPDRDLFDNELLMQYNDGQVWVMASRGCPYRCTYCCNTVLSDLAGGNAKWVRQRAVSDVIAELEELHRRFPEMKSITFMDELFILKKSWVEDFCGEYKKRFKTPFQVFLRPEVATRQLLALMRDAGLYSIIVGVESGNERIRREILNRKMTNEKIIQVFKWADELGLETWDFNMIGIPGETEETIRETMELNRIIRPHHVQVSIFYPFPGTPIYEKCKEMGLEMKDESTSVFLSKPVLDLPGLPREKILALHKEFVQMGHQIEAERTAQGYADLAALFSRAELRPGGEDYVGLWRVRILGDDRMAILMHPPSEVVFEVHVRPGSVLRFGMGFPEDVWDKPGGGALFEIRVKQKLRREQTVFSEYINPKRFRDQRRWLDREVDMTRFGGRRVQLTLKTSPDEDNRFAAAFWSRPYLVEKRPRTNHRV